MSYKNIRKVMIGMSVFVLTLVIVATFFQPLYHEPFVTTHSCTEMDDTVKAYHKATCMMYMSDEGKCDTIINGMACGGSGASITVGSASASPSSTSTSASSTNGMVRDGSGASITVSPSTSSSSASPSTIAVTSK